ncbi:hypothetical protein FDECE_15378 [Fusarium decemcellulare]|nr:hypothetical protein FDECE_15378 [Fusarium decemcellulare]
MMSGPAYGFNMAMEGPSYGFNTMSNDSARGSNAMSTGPTRGPSNVAMNHTRRSANNAANRAPHGNSTTVANGACRSGAHSRNNRNNRAFRENGNRTANGASQRNSNNSNRAPRNLGSSNIANRLPHGASITIIPRPQPVTQDVTAQEQVPQHSQVNMNNGTRSQAQSTQPAQGNGPEGRVQPGIISPPQEHVDMAQYRVPQPAPSGPIGRIPQSQSYSAAIPQSQPYTPGLPQSLSYSSGLSFANAGPTPQQLEESQVSGSFSGSGTGYNERLTEPRNYAPRTSGQPVGQHQPPPFNLNLELVVASPQASSQAASQEKPQEAVESPVASESNALIPFPNLPPPAVQQAMLAAPMPMPFHTNKSNKLIELTGTVSGYPTRQIAMSDGYFPFIDLPGSAKPAMFGVVRLKNIPFSAKRAEIVAFIGRNSKMLNDADEPVHIIMDRATSKTMDAFVEFATMEDAARCAERHHQFAQNGRAARIGDRNIEVELSSQAALMKELFPLARGVFWDGANPIVLPPNEREPWANFKGFISCEEMVMLVKHVEVPHRSPFSKECPQRPYECLISTLRKFPWFATYYITITQRGAMFKATVKLLHLLAKSIAQGDDPVNLNTGLFKRVVKSAMDCKGFTIMMKDNIAFMIDMSEMEQRIHGQPLNASSWVHQYTIATKRDAPRDVVDWYIRLIREQTTRDVLVRPIHERIALQETLKGTDDYWGYFFREVNYIQGPQFDTMTLGHCSRAEFTALERIITRALEGN